MVKKISSALLIIGVLSAIAYFWQTYKHGKGSAPRREQVQIAVATLAAGEYHILALTGDGKLFGWGSNAKMQLGLIGGSSDTDTHAPVSHNRWRIDSVPVPNQLPSQKNWRSIFSGTNAFYAVDAAGRAWRHPFVENIYGFPQDVKDWLEKRYVQYQLFDPSIRWRTIKQTWLISAGIDTNGTLRVWDESALQPSTEYSSPDGPPVNFFTVSPENEWLDFCLNGSTIYAVAADGSLWKHEGRIAFPKTSARSPEHAADAVAPASTLALTRQNFQAQYRRVVCRENSEHVLMIDRENRLWGFGRNSFGELGDGDGDEFTPTAAVPEGQVKQLTKQRWADVAIGPAFTFGIAVDGSLWGWGSGSRGQLGIGKDEYRDVPTLIDNKYTWVAVAASYLGGAALNNRGEIFTWGQNKGGILGDGGVASRRLAPARVFGTQAWGVNLKKSDGPGSRKQDGESLKEKIGRLLAEEISRSGIGCMRDLFEFPFSTRENKAQGKIDKHCDRCKDLYNAGLLSETVEEYTDQQGQKAYDIRYELTALGRSVFLSNAGEGSTNQSGKICFGSVRLYRIDEIHAPISINGETIYGVTYTMEMVAPNPFIFDPRSKILGVETLHPGSPALYAPRKTSVVLKGDSGYVDDSFQYGTSR